MRLIPLERETIVLPVPGSRVAGLIREKTQTTREEGEGRIFKGIVSKDEFTVTLKVTRAQIMIPQLHGEIEETTTGCIVFLKYRFFSNTNFFLIFWTLLSLLLTLIFLGPGNNRLYGSLSLLFCITNYLVALANFDIHSKQIKKALLSVLNQLKS